MGLFHFSIVISIEIKNFSWLASINGMKVKFNVTDSRLLGFISFFTVGGLTGIISSNSSINIVLPDIHHVVAHFHYVLLIGAVYAIFGSFIY